MAQIVPLGFFAKPRYNWNAFVQWKLKNSAVKHAQQTMHGFFAWLYLNVLETLIYKLS